MLVSQILKTKAPGVYTIAPDKTVAEAAVLLSERRIGALIVSTDGKKALGILSERDIVRELGRNGPESLTRRVDEMMTAKLVTCTSGDKNTDVMSRMTEGRFRHMPVIEQGQIVAMVTLGDVVKARLQELSAEKAALEGMIMGH
ncbi:CBS domain-containing protein [Pseudogemmobacter faecipullorum]|uniref:CBS domain-containing protein n=1 Tax=Pseudogemmobacter faecipullorum TaxID=2755041 RepID=A0ABS8CIB7_9RHOB|nr:CBS domain-containing protein [Pseudogemmobacter faecipullorum]MCB5409134.1 CBS domain-containing protein [Pseudogemmobacter faecipullorum]